MNRNEKTLATFRIENQKWEAFKAEARKNGSTASEVLLEFVNSYVEHKPAPTNTAPQPGIDNLDKLIESMGRDQFSRLAKDVKTLHKKVSHLENSHESLARITNLENSYESLTEEVNNLKKVITSQQEQTTNQSVQQVATPPTPRTTEATPIPTPRQTVPPHNR